MIVKNLGTWSLYQPIVIPRVYPPGALFAKRDSDGLDWYEQLYDYPERFFTLGSAKMTALKENGRWIIKAATTDAMRLFPVGQLLLEVVDYFGSDAQADFGGLEYNEATNTVAPISPPPVDLTAYARNARWRKESGGISVNGVPVATDDRSKQMIMGRRLAATADPDWSTEWDGSDGNVYHVTASAMIAISDAVQAHVNACFVAFAAVKSAIDAGIVTTPAEIDTAFS